MVEVDIPETLKLFTSNARKNNHNSLLTECISRNVNGLVGVFSGLTIYFQCLESSEHQETISYFSWPLVPCGSLGFMSLVFLAIEAIHKHYLED